MTVGRPEKVTLLQDLICDLCTDAGVEIDTETMTTGRQTFIRLQNELIKGLDALFVFVA